MTILSQFRPRAAVIEMRRLHDIATDLLLFALIRGTA